MSQIVQNWKSRKQQQHAVSGHAGRRARGGQSLDGRDWFQAVKLHSGAALAGAVELQRNTLLGLQQSDKRYSSPKKSPSKKNNSAR